MRVLIIMLSALILSGCIVKNSIMFKEESAVGKPDLMINGDFEESLAVEGDYVAPWFVMAKDKEIEVLQIDATVAANGTNSLKIEPSGQRKLIVSESFDIESKDGYFVKGSLKSTSANRSTITMEFRSYDKKGKLRDKFSMPYVPGDEWQKLTISAGLFKSSARYGRIIFIVPSYQHEPIWIDSVGCFKVHEFLN
ncbi:MAG: hypothetical protein P9L91_00575 [Candidatus Zophobacter franzmannii]|jgi:hypothetical protein|nr:hypothetical protein [Candidatus Zophobacter franzmannii]